MAHRKRCGAVAEWSKALAWKVSMGQKPIEGSNPSRSATPKSLILHSFLTFHVSRECAPLLPVIGTGERRGLETAFRECREILPGGIGQYRFSPRREAARVQRAS